MRSLEKEKEFLANLNEFWGLFYVITTSELIDKRKISLIKFVNNRIKCLITDREKELSEEEEEEEVSGCF